jgi:hypothetical protein
MPPTNKLGAFIMSNKIFIGSKFNHLAVLVGAVFGIILAVLIGIALSGTAYAARTMHLVDEYIDDDVKVCVYSDGRHYEELERNRASICPYTHIFY